MARTKVSENFYLDEFWCPCPDCRAEHSQVCVTPSTIAMAQGVRDDLGKPVVITSGIRCETYNASKTIRGAPLSRHLPQFADALDVLCTDSRDRFRMVELFIARGATTVILYPRHLHVDLGPGEKKILLGRYC